VVEPARRAALEAQEQGKGSEGIYCGVAIELRDGTIVTGSNSPLMHAASSVVIHAIKHLAGIPGMIKLLPPYVTDSVSRLKTEIMNERNTVSFDLPRSGFCTSRRSPALDVPVENDR
jgi:uncharacterized protein (UPF0371 family)